MPSHCILSVTSLQRFIERSMFCPFIYIIRRNNVLKLHFDTILSAQLTVCKKCKRSVCVYFCLTFFLLYSKTSNRLRWPDIVRHNTSASANNTYCMATTTALSRALRTRSNRQHYKPAVPTSLFYILVLLVRHSSPLGLILPSGSGLILSCANVVRVQPAICIISSTQIYIPFLYRPDNRHCRMQMSGCARR